MISDQEKQAISEVIRTIVLLQKNQNEIDNFYSEFCDINSKEMNTTLQCKDESKKTRK